MKFNSIFNGMTAMALAIGPVAGAEVKPAGTILASYCGENVAAAQERNRAITEVCLGTVVDSEIEVVIIRSENARGVAQPDQVLPIVKKKMLKPSSSAFMKEQLVLGSSEVDSSTRYDILKTTSAILTTSTGRTRVPTPATPTKLKGKDLNGIEFEVNQLDVIFHTQSL